MFKQIFLFELKLWLKKPATYIFFFVFFGLSMFATAALSGLIGTSGDTNVTINSAKAIAESLNGLITDIVGIIILITIIAPAVYKDFQYNMHPLLFTNPITKFGYMFGRFFASFLVAMFVITGAIVGHVVTCAIPGIEPERLSVFNLINYIQPFLFLRFPIFYWSVLFSFRWLLFQET
ncbi:MAG: hypothetical protein IPP64_10395 [Bacteroidetes bacterium]|nr:hypothetical protein [Bacteroidota bacterium]